MGTPARSSVASTVGTLLLVAISLAESPMASPPSASSAPQSAAPKAGRELSAESAGSRTVALRSLLAQLFPDGVLQEIDSAGFRVRHSDGTLLLSWSTVPPDLRLGEARNSKAVGTWKTPSPGYPFQARKTRVAGTLQVVLRTDTSGRVAQAVVCPGLDPVLDEHVLSFIRREWSGPPLTVRWVPLSFQLRD